ncbi:MAG: DUF3788 family protein [Bacteroidales bacterium]|nr:DUF3788 family protein [Bacteroidales bacterium]
MEQSVLNDKSVKPTDEIIFSIIGDKELLWKQILSYVYDNNKDISEEWKYYNDGKSWLFRVFKKKKTLFWIRILKDTFRIAFWFGDKLEPIILESELPDNIKSEFKNAKRFNKSRCIYIDMEDSGDFENVKKLTDIKVNN